MRRNVIASEAKQSMGASDIFGRVDCFVAPVRTP
jgi:hypothetical protein